MLNITKWLGAFVVAALTSLTVYAEGESAIKITKTIDWDLKSPDATVNVTTYTSPDMTPKAAQVLFLGGLCGAHTLEIDTIVQSLEAAAVNADIEYHLYNDQIHHTDADVHGTLLRGKKLPSDFKDDLPKKSSTELYDENHAVLFGFLNKICERLDSTKDTYKKYDYVVLEFDGNRLVHGLDASKLAANIGSSTATETGKQQLADYLVHCASLIEPYYNESRVLWIVDDRTTKETTANTKQDQFNYDPFSELYYVPANYCFINEFQRFTDEKYAMLCSLVYPKGLTNPSGCKGGRTNKISNFNNFQCGYEEKRTIEIWGQGGRTSQDYYRGAENEKQVFYNDSGDVVNFIDDNVKPAPYNVTLDDTIRLDDELKITGVTAQLILCDTAAKKTAYDGKTEEQVRNSADWQTIYVWQPGGATTQNAASGLSPDGSSVDSALNAVVLALTNFQYSAWARVKISVNDEKGLFRTTLHNAIYDEATKTWKKNPNKGLAHAVLRNTTTGSELKVDAYADVAIENLWQYEVPLVEVVPVPGQYAAVAGVWTDKTNAVEKTDGKYMVYSNLTVDVDFSTAGTPGAYYCDFGEGAFTNRQTKTDIADKPVTTIPGDDALLGIQVGETAWAFVQNDFDKLNSGNCWIVGSGSTYAYAERNTNDLLFVNRPLYLNKRWQQIKNVYFRENVTTVGTNFFAGMKAVKNVEMNDKVTTLEADAFFKCVSLTNATVGANVTSLGENAFGLCHSLETLRLPNASVAGADEAVQITARITMDGGTPVIDATPQIVIPGTVQTLWGKKELADENWDKLTGTIPADYHFFKITYE